ncbi:MAG: hypothetical protein U9N33_04545 [Campylobacterota bacterium]|nr:hypothetical protein [Campylobacterota bacterium]
MRFLLATNDSSFYSNTTCKDSLQADKISLSTKPIDIMHICSLYF